MPGILKNDFFTGKQRPYNAVQHLCTVKFLDNSDPISVTYERDTKGRFLVDHVCSSIDLIERDYFGLKYTDTDKQECWLDPQKTIHSQIKGLPNSVLYFQVKYYPSDLDAVKEEITRYQLFLQVRKDFNDSKLICSLQDALQLSAYVVQDEIGDYDDVVNLESHAAQVKIPAALRGYEEEIMIIQRQLKGLGQSEVEYKFLQKAASLSSYGIDPYIVSDVKGEAMYLAISPKGIIIIEDNVPVKTYKWKDIWKLSFDGKTFYIKSSGKEKNTGKGFQNVRNHFGASLFACTSVNKKPSQQSTDTYKCLSHANCKQLWKNAVAHKYFYTLQSSSEAPKVLTSGGLFIRGSKFRYSGNCLEEIHKSSSSINREEPRVTRHLSNIEIGKDGGCSTLPHGWKHNTSIGEDASDARRLASDSEKNESAIPSRQFVRTTSSDSFSEKTPATSDLEAPELFPNAGDEETNAIDSGKEMEVTNLSTHGQSRDAHSCKFGAAALFSTSNDSSRINGSVEKTGGDDDDDDDDEIDDDVSTVHGEEAERVTDDDEHHHNLSESSHPTVEVEFCESTDLSETCSSLDVTCDESNDCKEGVGSRKRTNDARECKSSGTIDEVENFSRKDERKKIRNRRESGSGYDTGYMSSGSEMLSRSFEGDEVASNVSTIKSNGILEEMEFPLTPDDPPADENEDFKNETGATEMPNGDVHSPLMREELLSLLAYGSENLASCISERERNDRGELDAIAKTSDEAPFSCGNLSTFSCSLPSVDDQSRRIDCHSNPFPDASVPFHSSPSFGQTMASGHLMSGVFSSDNFKRIKEIEKMIEDNKNKILLMKDAISSEIKKSIQGNAPAKPVDPLEMTSLHSNNPDALNLSKQSKHVSFSSHNTEWHRGDSNMPLENLRSWSNRKTFINYDDGAVDGFGVTDELKEGHFGEGAGDVVEKIPVASPSGVLITEAELCKCSDNSDSTDDGTTSPGKDEAQDKTSGDTLKVLRSEGSGGSVYSSFSLPQTSTKNPTIETKVENFTFSETVVEEIVKVTPEILEALSLSLHRSSSLNLSSSDVVSAVASSDPSNESDELIEQVPSVEEKCTATNEFLQILKDDENSRAQSRDESIAWSTGSFCRGLGTSLLSVSVLTIIFVAFLVVVFELNQEVPYVTDQEAILELKKSVYAPARERLMRLFQE